MNFEEDIQSCLNVLRDGGVILYPTDTIWGLGCDATNEDAVTKIIHIKQNTASKSMVLLVAEERDILRYTAAPDMAIFDYLQTMPKPTTVIYSGAIGLAENLLYSDGSVGIRIVQDTFCKHLIKRFGKPIVSTTANRSDTPIPVFFSDITDTIKSNADYIVQYRQTDTLPTTPSSIIRWNNGSVEIVRD